MKKEEYDKIIYLMNHGALQGIDTGRLDGKCEDVIPLEDAIAIVDLIYKSENAVLEQIRTEIEQIEINGHIRDVECFRAGINTALDIIDKYKTESEVNNG